MMDEKQHGKPTMFRSIYIYGIILAVLVIAIVLIANAMASSYGAAVAAGDNVSVYYTGKFLNGTVFSTNVGKAPFNFTVGKGEVIKGFDNAVIGMKVGENKTVTIQPSEAYGAVNLSRIVAVPISAFGNGSVQPGLIVTTQSGQQGEIISANATTVIVDFNSPLAGKTLVFQIYIISISK